tara:strand:- start:242 stop:406 length:165 start_codon:yes stop_codon:yes gene_type:complete
MKYLDNDNSVHIKDIDPYAQHPERYTATFWLGFCLLGGYKFFVVLILLLLWLIL